MVADRTLSVIPDRYLAQEWQHYGVTLRHRARRLNHGYSSRHERLQEVYPEHAGIAAPVKWGRTEYHRARCGPGAARQEVAERGDSRPDMSWHYVGGGRAGDRAGYGADCLHGVYKMFVTGWRYL
ncbi:hypothetical protein [Nitrospira sp. Kam-Ns4a]